MRIIIIPTLMTLLFFCSQDCLLIHADPLEQPSARADDTPSVEARDYCSDPDLKLQWEFLISKYPEDMGLQALHALRLGLCIKVERNDISLEDALKIFEDVKKSFVEKKLDELLVDPDE